MKELTGTVANVNLHNKYLTPLTTAFQIGDSDIVEELIKARADVNQKDIVHALLTATREYKNVNIAEVLLVTEATINSEEKKFKSSSFACLKCYLFNVKS